MQTNEYKQKRTYWWEMGVVNTVCECVACRHRSAERKKKTKKKKLTWVWMMDACVRSDVLRADAN